MRVTVNRFALRALREKDGQSVVGLARLAGISSSMLCHIEAGRKAAGPSLRKRLAAGLNVRTSSIEAQIIEAPEPVAEREAA
jgi:transcriptional regulator with XRE-family HTH domain